MTILIRLILLFFAFTLCNMVRAAVQIDIYKGHFTQYNFSYVPFFVDQQVPSVLSHVGEIIRWDLQSSGYFKFMPTQQDMQISKVSNIPTTSIWNQVHVQFLILGQVQVHQVHSLISGSSKIDQKADSNNPKITKDFQKSQHNTYYEVKVVVWDIERGKILLTKSYTLDNLFRMWIHQISNDVYQSITGQQGYFDSHIAFTEKDQKGYHLGLMDQNGHNIQYLMRNTSYIIAPHFSKDNSKIVFVYEKNNIPQIAMMDLISGIKTNINTHMHPTLSPSFAKNDSLLLYARTPNAQVGGTEIFSYNIKTHKEKQLTHDNSININPVISANQRYIAFLSDQSGKPNIYVMDIHGKHEHRISFGGGQYFSPSWSHHGTKIVFSKNLHGLFSIGVMNMNGSHEHTLVLPSYAKKLNPIFAPTDKVILYVQKSDITSNHQDLYKVLSSVSANSVSNTQNLWSVPIKKNIVMVDWSGKILYNKGQ